MQSLKAGMAVPPTSTAVHLALAGFADGVVGTLAHLFAYVGALALFAILALAALGQLPKLRDDEPAEKPGGAWPTVRTRPSPLVGSIHPRKQPLTPSSGILKAAAGT